MTVRQTNVVWLGFVLGISVLAEVRKEEGRRAVKEDESQSCVVSDPVLGDVVHPGEACRVTHDQADGGVAQIVKALTSTLSSIHSARDRISRIILPYSPTFLGFLVFLRWNGGIVLGELVYQCEPTELSSSRA